jgi:hypothetical protein
MKPLGYYAVGLPAVSTATTGNSKAVTYYQTCTTVQADEYLG